MASNSFADLAREEHRDPVPAKPAADVARILDHAKVPNVLWGWLAVGLVGKDHRYPEVDFVVADNKLKSANEALAASFTHCTNLACDELREDRLSPEALWSVWWPGLTLTCARTDAKCPDDERFPNDHPYFVLSNDTSLYNNLDGSGPWDGSYAAKLLKPSLLAEAIIFLWCRDYGHIKGVHNGWRAMVDFGLIGLERVDTQREIIGKGLKP